MHICTHAQVLVGSKESTKDCALRQPFTLLMISCRSVHKDATRLPDTMANIMHNTHLSLLCWHCPSGVCACGRACYRVNIVRDDWKTSVVTRWVIHTHTYSHKDAKSACADTPRIKIQHHEEVEGVKCLCCFYLIFYTSEQCVSWHIQQDSITQGDDQSKRPLQRSPSHCRDLPETLRLKVKREQCSQYRDEEEAEGKKEGRKKTKK